ncbi:MAG TPA: hypothetical protein VFP61_07055 [Acidimicrobiales bacterium]|nr:hypothetical protein [Acidimicrobiales bacterium]
MSPKPRPAVARRGHQRGTARQRDVALRNLHSATRWVVGASVVMVGLTSAIVAEVLPGRSAGAATQAAPGGATATGTAGVGQSTPSTGSSDTPSLQAPAQVPVTAAPATTPAPVVSGGS